MLAVEEGPPGSPGPDRRLARRARTSGGLPKDAGVPPAGPASMRTRQNLKHRDGVGLNRAGDAPAGIRTPVTGLKGLHEWPLHHLCVVESAGSGESGALVGAGLAKREFQ